MKNETNYLNSHFRLQKWAGRRSLCTVTLLVSQTLLSFAVDFIDQTKRRFITWCPRTPWELTDELQRPRQTPEIIFKTCALLSFSNQRFLLFPQTLKGHHHCINFLCCITNYHKQRCKTAPTYYLTVALGQAFTAQRGPLPSVSPGRRRTVGGLRSFLELGSSFRLMRLQPEFKSLWLKDGGPILLQPSAGVHAQLLKTPIVRATWPPPRRSQSWRLTSQPARASPVLVCYTSLM